MAEGNGQPTNGPANGHDQVDWKEVYHVGPGTLAGRYLRRWWHPVYRSSQLAPERAVPIRVLGEDLTLYRGGEAGTPHLLAFRCAHRGTQLSTGWVEGENLRCFYHGWMYGPDGQCLEQPAEPEPFCSRIRLQSYPTEEYLGLIFAYLGEGEPPPLPRYPELSTEGVLETSEYTWPCSFFNSLENGVDPTHLAFVHRESAFTDAGLIDVPRVEAEETEFGLSHHAIRPSGVRTIHVTWPNIQYRTTTPPFPGVPWGDVFAWRVPVDDTHFKTFSTDLVHVTGEQVERYREMQAKKAAEPRPFVPELGERILRGEMHVDEVTDPRIRVNVQDYVAQIGQGAIPDVAHEHLGRGDAAVIVLRNIWRRELRALAEGRPLKEWTRPPILVATSGVGAG